MCRKMALVAGSFSRSWEAGQLATAPDVGLHWPDHLASHPDPTWEGTCSLDPIPDLASRVAWASLGSQTADKL